MAIDRDGCDIDMGRLYVVDDVFFALVRPTSHSAVYAPGEDNNVHCEFLWPVSSMPQFLTMLNGKRLKRIDPVVLGRRFQEFLTALRIYREEVQL